MDGRRQRPFHCSHGRKTTVLKACTEDVDTIMYLDNKAGVFMKNTNAPPLQGHAPDSSGLCSSSTAWGSQFTVDLARRPVFYNPGILIALTITWNCLMNLSRRGVKNKNHMERPSHRKSFRNARSTEPEK